MDKIFYPASVVLVGVSEKTDNLAHNMANNFFRYNYHGDMYYLGRTEGELHERPIVTSVQELPANIDLAVILTPAATVPEFLDKLGEKGVHYAVIETAGFSEFSAEGAQIEQEIARIAEKWKIKIVGPNCVGVLCMESGVNSVFVNMDGKEIQAGNVSVISQSGGIFLTLVDFLTASGLGASKAVSVGNKLVLTEPDYISYFQQDAHTQTILLYLESIDHGRELVKLAQQGSKPVVIYKSNTSQASAEIAHSHTAALSNDDQLVSAAFKQFGVTRVNSFREMLLAAKGFSLPPVRGNKLVVLSRSGGHGIITVDCAHQFGFELPQIDEALLEMAKPFFRVNVIERQNPLDLGTVFNFDSYPILIEHAIQIMHPDAMLLIFNYRAETREKAREIALKIKLLSEQYQTPIALCYFTELEEIHRLERELNYPVYGEVLDAIQSLAYVRDRYQQNQQRAVYQQDWENAIIPKHARQIASQILSKTNGNELQIDQVLQICEAYGLSTAPWGLAEGEQAALALAEKIGYPLVMKAAGAGSLHKTDVGGVVLNLTSKEAVSQAFRTIQQNLELHGYLLSPRVLIQKMVKGGKEIIVGGKFDPSFGPFVLCGLGGIYAEVLRDVNMSLAPISPLEAYEMLSELHGVDYLRGVRGEKGVDLHKLAGLVSTISQLMADFEEIAELDLNPVLALSDAVLIVDARLLLRN